MHQADFRQEDLRVTASDGYSLAARVYFPYEADQCKAGLLISSGTGYPKEFYARFAQYGVTRGFACMIYDYRGIGASAPEDMRDCDADLLDWGTLDAPAALNALVEGLEGQPVFTLGHSFGGQLVGLMDNHTLAKGHAFVAVGNGYWAHHHPRDWWKEFLFFAVLGPTSIKQHGYLKGIEYWPGSSMPAGVFKQWRRWCLSPHYYCKDIQKKLGEAYFEMNNAPMRQFAFTDDPVVNAKSEAFIRQCYNDAAYETNWIDPTELGISSIGHSGAFSRRSKAFWPIPFDWFETLIS